MKKFTLIELLVVVSIISILVSILLPSLNKAREKAYVSVCLNNLKQISTGLYTYAADKNGNFPPGQPNFTPHSGDRSYKGFRAIYGEKEFNGPGLLLKFGLVTAELFYCPKEPKDVDSIDGHLGLKTRFPNGDYTQTPDSFARYSYHYQGNYKDLDVAGWGRTINPKLHPGDAVVMPEHFSDIIHQNFHHGGKRLNLLYLDGSAMFSAPPADVKVRVDHVTDWRAITVSLRRMDR